MNPPSSSPPPPSLAPPHSDDYSEQSPPDGPSPSYLEFASTPSKTLSEPTCKLLILGLNGTLLRSQALPQPTPSAPRASPRHAPRVSHRLPRVSLRAADTRLARRHGLELGAAPQRRRYDVRHFWPRSRQVPRHMGVGHLRAHRRSLPCVLPSPQSPSSP